MEARNKRKINRLVRKWVRLVLVIVSSILLLNKPVFNFVDEKGIESVKTYKMTTRTFEAHYVDMTTGLDELMGATSVNGLFYGALAILIGCVVCTVFYSFHRFRIIICSITAFLAGAYYVLIGYYAILLSYKFFLILYPNWVAILPVVVLVTMLSIRNETVRKLVDANQDEDEGSHHRHHSS